MKFRLLLLTSCIPLLTSCEYNETTGEMETTWFFWVFIILVIGGAAMSIKADNAKKKAAAEKGKAMSQAAKENFNVTAQVEGFRSNFKFIVDDKANEVIIMRSTTNFQKIPFADIMGVEVMEDGTVLQSKSMMRTVGGGIVGNIVAGGAGMIVGGLSGDTKEKKKVSKVFVKIKLRNLTESSITLLCYDAWEATGLTKKEIKTTDSVYGPDYRKGLNAANRIAELLGVIIYANDRALKQVAPAQPAAPTQTSSATAETSNYSVSIVDEIKKLADMKAQGLITDEEFTALKSKIIK